MFTNKNTSDYREALRAARITAEEHRKAEREYKAEYNRLLDKIWRPRKGIFSPQSVHSTPAMREPSEGCALDGYEHSDQVQNYHPEGFWRLHCAHEHLYWQECRRCNRGKDEAAANFKKLQEGKL